MSQQPVPHTALGQMLQRLLQRQARRELTAADQAMLEDITQFWQAYQRQQADAAAQTAANGKRFRVVTRSDNWNSFGLRSIVVLAQDGEAWQLLRNFQAPGYMPGYEFTGGREHWARLGFEVPAELQVLTEEGIRAQAAVVAQVWNTP